MTPRKRKRALLLRRRGAKTSSTDLSLCACGTAILGCAPDDFNRPIESANFDGPPMQLRICPAPRLQSRHFETIVRFEAFISQCFSAKMVIADGFRPTLNEDD